MPWKQKPVQAITHGFVLFRFAMIGVVSWQIDKVARVRHGEIDFIDECLKIAIILLVAGGHVQITKMHPRDNFLKSLELCGRRCVSVLHHVRASFSARVCGSGCSVSGTMSHRTKRSANAIAARPRKEAR